MVNLNYISKLSVPEQITEINKIKIALHEISPFKNEPVDCVIWVPNEVVKANDYNPNQVAPPEMALLKTSVNADGYTQPIVTLAEEGEYIVIDGFHRSRVGREDAAIKQRILGYLPVTVIRASQEDRSDRIAATIRHNRARGKHRIQGMTDIVLELKRRNWSDQKIATNLGMDQDEILRLTQIGGLSQMFTDTEFSASWEPSDELDEVEE